MLLLLEREHGDRGESRRKVVCPCNIYLNRKSKVIGGWWSKGGGPRERICGWKDLFGLITLVWV
jgi:hypothetical protein